MAKVVPGGGGDSGAGGTNDALGKMLAVVEVKAAREMTAEEQIAAFEEKLKKMRTPDNAACILDPRTEFRKKWDIVMILLLLFTATVTPFEVGMGIPTEMSALFIVNQLVNIAFIFDMGMNFMLASQDYETGAWVLNHRSIALAYFKSWFALDFVSVLPFDSLSLALDDESCATTPRSQRNACLSDLKIFRIIRLLRLLKLLRILRASRIFKRWETQISISYAARSLMKFFVAVLFLAHWIGCAHRLLPQMEETEAAKHADIDAGKAANWMEGYASTDGLDFRYTRMMEANVTDPLTGLTALKIVADPLFVGDFHMYTVSMYWSIMTLSTIGYGDVPIVTHSERVLAVVCMLIGAGVYAYMVGAICGIVASMDQLTTEFNQTMDSLNDYMSEMGLPKDMRYKLRSYFHHCKHINRVRSYKHLLEGMSPALRGRVTSLVHGPSLKNVYFFNCADDEETDRFVTQLSMCMGAEAYAPQETVVAVNSIAEKLYLVESGLASKEGQLFTKETFFGEDFILTEARRHYHVLAVNYLDVYTISRDDMQSVLDNNRFPLMKKKIRLAMVRLAFFRRIRPYIFSICQAYPERYTLPESMRARAEKAAAASGEGGGGALTLEAEGAKLIRRGSGVDEQPDLVSLTAQFNDCVERARGLEAAEMAGFMGELGSAVAAIAGHAAKGVAASVPPKGSAAHAAVKANRKMSGLDLDDVTRAMASEEEVNM
jgi:potassium voltage-gated channel Eag-related subfamily H protein 7